MILITKYFSPDLCISLKKHSDVSEERKTEFTGEMLKENYRGSGYPEYPLLL